MQRSLSMAELQIDCCEKMVEIVVVVAASKSSALRAFFPLLNCDRLQGEMAIQSFVSVFGSKTS